MRVIALSMLAASIIDPATIQHLLQHYFYAGLLGVLVLASLGLPIPEDIPLIAAGVILKLQPDGPSWAGAFLTAMIGIMSGDLVLYMAGRLWGKDVVNHSSVNWIITPERFARACESFGRWGVWFVFFGRFVMGIRAVMCLTAGATRYPYWRFFLADFCGALITVPMFIGLGYVFAEHLMSLYKWLAEIQGALVVVVVLLVGGFIVYEYRRFTAQNAPALQPASSGDGPVDLPEVAKEDAPVSQRPTVGGLARPENLRSGKFRAVEPGGV